MAIEIETFTVIGLTPLVLHNPAAMLTPAEDTVKTKKQSIPTAKDEAERGLYRDGRGHIYIPPIGFKKGILYAASGRKIGKMTAIRAMSAGVFEIGDQAFLFDPQTRAPITEWEVYVTSAVIAKSRILRARPRINSWGCSFPLEIDTDYVLRHHVEEMLAIAGLMSGAGDFRPQKGGRFGRYRLAEAEEMRVAAE